uniref:Uncharacterized protein n=1 Tax=Ditylenchus dipsaci TaxID=166011 RepID=A0A915EWX6_9BILA
MAVEEFGRILDYVAALHYIEEVDYPFIYELVVKAARSKNVILKPPYDCEKTTSETDIVLILESLNMGKKSAKKNLSQNTLQPAIINLKESSKDSGNSSIDSSNAQLFQQFLQYVESGKQSSIQSTGNETGNDADIFNLLKYCEFRKKKSSQRAVDDNRKELDYAFKFIRRSSVHQKRLEDAMKNLRSSFAVNFSAFYFVAVILLFNTCLHFFN